MSDIQFIALLVFAFFVFSAALIYVNLNVINSYGGGDEFYLPWSGGRAFLFDHIEPYSTAIPEQVQELVYGRAARAGEEPFILDIPFHILLLYFPFSLLSDPQLARAIFTLVVELALLGLAYLSLRLTDWNSSLVFSILFFIFCLLNFYSVHALLEATPVLVLGLIYAAVLLALRAELDELAGALIALACYYWEVGGPFIVLVLLYIIHNRRQRALAGFGMLAAILLAVSFLIYPDWLIPFLRATSNNLRADFGYSTRVVLSQFWPNFGNRLAWGVTLLLIIALGYEFVIARGANFRRLYWASCFSIAATPLLGFRTEIENLAILILPIALIFAITYERWRLTGRVLIFVLLIFLFVVPWGIYFIGIPRFGKLAEETLFLFYPVFTIIGVYWIRWWAIRPPRTWFDHARLN